MVRYEQPTQDHINLIASSMRQEDADEVRAMGHEPLEALQMSVKNSDFAITVVIDNVPTTILGLVRKDILAGTGTPWLLSSTNALNHKRKFLELSPPVIEEMLHICPKLVNYVHSKNKLSIRWLRWLGFIIDEAYPIGVNGEMFHKFHKEA